MLFEDPFLVSCCFHVYTMDTGTIVIIMIFTVLQLYVHEGPSDFFFVLVCSDILASLLLETVLISLGT